MGRSQCPEKPQIVFAVRNVVKRFLPGLSSAPAAAPIRQGPADPGDKGTDGYVHSVSCPECGAELSPPSRFCTVCGKRIGTVTAWSFDECYCCGAKLTPGQRFCTQCGESFDRPTSAQIKRPSKRKEGNREQIMVVEILKSSLKI